MRVHAPALCELVVAELALYSLDLEMNRVDVSIEHVHTTVRFGADVTVDGGFCGDLAWSERTVWVVGGIEGVGTWGEMVRRVRLWVQELTVSVVCCGV